METDGFGTGTSLWGELTAPATFMTPKAADVSEATALKVAFNDLT